MMGMIVNEVFFVHGIYGGPNSHQFHASDDARDSGSDSIHMTANATRSHIRALANQKQFYAVPETRFEKMVE